MEDIKLPPPRRPITGRIACFLFFAAVAFVVTVILTGGRP